MTFAGVVGLIVAWAIFGSIAYFHSQNPYRWPKKWGVLFALGGPITAMGAVIDVWQHTSMGGEYTRNWKSDPEKGIHVITWRELEGKPPETRWEKFLKSALMVSSNCAQLFGGYTLMRAMSGHQASVVGTIGAIVLCTGLGVLLYELFVFYAGVKQEEAAERMVLFNDYVVEVFFLEFIAFFLLAIPGLCYRISRNI